MNAPDVSEAGSHPSREVLLAFSVGNLPEDVQESIAAHLAGCADCVAVLKELESSADSLLAELRQLLSPGALAAPEAQPAAQHRPPDLPASTDLEAPRPGAASAGPAPPCPVPSAPTRYQVRRFHARGGLGEVHVAHDQELDRGVALKRLRVERAGDADSRRRFVLEAEITGKLEHPGVVPVYGLVQDASGAACYAMRFVEGQTLKEGIEQFHAGEGRGRDPGARRLALRQLLGRFVAVCNTVAYAHSRGIVHRDSSPPTSCWASTARRCWWTGVWPSRSPAARPSGPAASRPWPRVWAAAARGRRRWARQWARRPT
jgi:hypothetical protein